ncbi:hypothetical protein ACFV4F_32555, partial [Kitasatospora sp. NPDC059722]
MRRDESRGSARPLTAPRLPPGPLREFKSHLYRLYLAAGTPSLDRIAEDIADNDTLTAAPSRDTVNQLLGRGRRGPDRAKLPGLLDAEALAISLARVAGRADVEEVADRTRQLWIEAKNSPESPMRTAEQWGATVLGVHAALTVGDWGDERITPYLDREHDRLLRGRLRRAATGRKSALAVLIGRSSTGKTRAAYEAVCGELPDWPLLVPSGPADLVDWVATDSVDVRTVLWLDEAQRYLLGPLGEDCSGALAALLNQVAPVVVVGSMWPEYARSLTLRPGRRPDQHIRARSLLEAYRAEIHVPDHLGDDLAGARKLAAEDPRFAAPRGPRPRRPPAPRGPVPPALAGPRPGAGAPR